MATAMRGAVRAALPGTAAPARRAAIAVRARAPQAASRPRHVRPMPTTRPAIACAASAASAPASGARAELDTLSETVDALRAEMVAGEAAYARELAAVHPDCRDSARNLVHYLILRRADRRQLQAELQAYGLSSLGSCEAHVLPTLDAVSTALAALRGAGRGTPRRAAFDRGSALLQRNADAALGPSPAAHRTRVVVTAPPDAATDPAVLAALLAAQMNILRINAAHDGAVAWGRMVGHLRAAELAAGSSNGPTRVQFDLAGPKLRTGAIQPEPPRARWEVSEQCSVVFHVEGGAADAPADAPTVGLRVPLRAADGAAMVGAARVGDAVRLVDARGRKRELRVTDVGAGWAAASADRRGVVAPGLGVELRRRRGAAEAAEEEKDSKAKGSKSKSKDSKKSSSTTKNKKKGGRNDDDSSSDEEDEDEEEDDGDASDAAWPPARYHLRDARTLAAAAVGALPPQPGALLLHTGDTVTLRLGDFPGAPPAAPGGDAILAIPLAEVFAALRPGHRVFFDDGKFEGTVLSANGRDCARLALTRVRGGAAKLAGEKGINLPDSPLALPALTDDDRADLARILPLRPDLIALSFVQTPADVAELHAALHAAGAAAEDTAVLLKIETAAAFAALPQLLLAAMQRPNFAVMVARGDLAVEVGFARMSEVQEEMLWLCEAAHAPVVWATQVLDSMARTGAPSRGEVTDAAMAGRAEAVLNKGPFMPDVLHLLRDVLSRLSEHERKKMHLLRRLSVCDVPGSAAASADGDNAASGNSNN